MFKILGETSRERKIGRIYVEYNFFWLDIVHDTINRVQDIKCTNTRLKLKCRNEELKLIFNLSFFFIIFSIDHQDIKININKIRRSFQEENYITESIFLATITVPRIRISNITRKRVETKGGKLQREQENKKKN